jgi:hypothetical protein
MIAPACARSAFACLTAQDRGRLHVDDAAAGDVVEDDRHVDGLGDRAEVAVQALLRRLVVVRDDRHDRVHPERDDLLGELHRIRRAVVARIRYDRRTAGHGLEHRAEELDLLVVEDGRALPRRAADDERLRA